MLIDIFTRSIQQIGFHLHCHIERELFDHGYIRCKGQLPDFRPVEEDSQVIGFTGDIIEYAETGAVEMRRCREAHRAKVRELVDRLEEQFGISVPRAQGIAHSRALEMRLLLNADLDERFALPLIKLSRPLK